VIAAVAPRNTFSLPVTAERLSGSGWRYRVSATIAPEAGFKEELQEGEPMHRLRRHLNYANVAATLALVIAVAGGTTAIAGGKGSKTNDINKKGNIRAGKVTAKKLADGGVTAAKLARIDVVQRDFATFGPGHDADCPVGERLLRGGVDIHSPSPTGAAITSSHPVGNSWEGNVTTATTNHTVYALCLR
jgi:hypothetical protein